MSKLWNHFYSAYHSNLLQHKNTITTRRWYFIFFNIKHVLNIIHSTPSIYYLYMVDPRAFLFPCWWSWSSVMKNDSLNGFFSLGWASPFAPCFWRRRHNANKTHANSLAFSLSLQTLSQFWITVLWCYFSTLGQTSHEELGWHKQCWMHQRKSNHSSQAFGNNL